MGSTTRAFKLGLQGAFYLLILALIISRSVTTNISHDENQFIAPGQLLAYKGLLPYVNYPYTHMPYSAVFYAVSALASDFDFLAGRILSGLAWFGCILVMVAMGRLIRKGADAAADPDPTWMQILWEFLLVYVFVHHGPVLFVLGTALNHSLATLFSLLAAWCFCRGVLGRGELKRMAWLSGACVMLAGLTRFNYVSLVVVMLGCWSIFALRFRRDQTRQILLRCAGGMLIASLPVLVLIALAPRAFYYGNLVYIRLNTVYYEGLLRSSGMSLASKLTGFVTGILMQPLDMLLYGLLILTAAVSTVGLIRRGPEQHLTRFAVAGMAITLWLTALAPTPALLQYFAAPVPFLFILLGALNLGSGRFRRPVPALGALAVLLAAVTSIHFTNPMQELAVLGSPSKWPPVQVHALAVSLRERVEGGRILTLQPMVPLEAGLDAYAFAATGPFSWRTSPLLTPERRKEYGVTSPEELTSLLNESPPAGILVGFEAPNAGFERQQMGGLEQPFSDYAEAHGYARVALTTPFWPRGLTLWIRP